VIPATQRKLREAQFFYEKLVRESRKTIRSEEFGYYYSAFLSAARAVPWVLQNEEKARYLAWNPTWEEKLTSEESKLLELTNELRLDEVKRAGAKSIVELEEVPFDVLSARPRGHFPYMQSSTLPGATPPKIGRWVHYVDQEGGKEEVTAMCKRYLEYLEKFVQEFLRAHE
jgi:hypothetical protein